MNELFETFKSIQKKLKAYDLVLGIAGWDSHTEAPKACFPYRAEMLSIMSGERFALMTSQAYQDDVNTLMVNLDQLNDMQQKEIKYAKRNLDQVVKIPYDEYVAYAKLVNISQRFWEEAKETNNYDHFKPYLLQIIEAKKKMITYRAQAKAPYDVLLDDFEEGMDMEHYDAFFATIKQDLVPFVNQILNAPKNCKDTFITAHYGKDKQKQFVEYLMDVFAYNRDSGLLKQSVHPFTWHTHSQDVRFTVRYLENFLFSSIFAGIHELGHALYEQQIDPTLDQTNLGGGASMGVHESQSRFYENIVGRSLPFWEIHYKKLQSLFPEQLKTVTVDEFYRGVNKVEQSFIRVEADELTYPLHILLRYEIERMIFNEGLDVETLPDVWNEKMKEYLNLDVKTNEEGILQDVHWSAGMFGYFPTYALGSAYAAQIYYTLIKEIDFEQLIKNDDIKAINEWLRNKLHCFGKTKKPKELLQSITNEPFNPNYYIRYLKEKYTELYLK